MATWWDHPRACGEHYSFTDTPSLFEGSSPRLRGTLAVVPCVGSDDGIIPALAGNTAIRRASGLRMRDHPRACGEHGVVNCTAPLGVGSSPRLRGTRGLADIACDGGGIIPVF